MNNSKLASKLLNVAVMKRIALILALGSSACGVETNVKSGVNAAQQTLMADNSTPGPKTSDPKASAIAPVPKPLESPRPGSGDIQLPQDPIPVFESKTAPQPTPVFRPLVGGIPPGQS